MSIKTMLVIALPVMLVIAAFAMMSISSRSGMPPGLAGGRLKPCGGNPNCVTSDVARDNTGYIDPLAAEEDDLDVVWRKLNAAVAAAGGVIQTDGPPYLAATFTSKTFGFVDDLECLWDREAGVIQVRSAARVGYSDLGVNRARVERIRALLLAP